jgi:hypothetical protein
MKRDIRLLQGVVVLALGGCASAELTYNTLDLASSTDDLMTEQVFHNLSNFIDSDLAYPAQLVLGSGSATTSDTLSANYTNPLTAAIQTTSTVAAASLQVTNTLAKAVSTGSSGNTTTTTAATQTTSPLGPGLQTQSGRASSSLGLGAQAVRSQLWSYVPVTDAFRAARLMALYHYVIYGSAYPGNSVRYAQAMREEYPLINRAVNRTESACLADANGKTILGKNLPFVVTAQGQSVYKNADARLTAKEAINTAKHFSDAAQAVNEAASQLSNADTLSMKVAKDAAQLAALAASALVAAEDADKAAYKADNAEAVARQAIDHLHDPGPYAVGQAYAMAKQSARLANGAATKAVTAITAAQQLAENTSYRRKIAC